LFSNWSRKKRGNWLIYNPLGLIRFQFELWAITIGPKTAGFSGPADLIGSGLLFIFYLVVCRGIAATTTGF